jgi:hypothetical protein
LAATGFRLRTGPKTNHDDVIEIDAGPHPDVDEIRDGNAESTSYDVHGLQAWISQ